MQKSKVISVFDSTNTNEVLQAELDKLLSSKCKILGIETATLQHATDTPELIVIIIYEKID